MTSQGRSKRTLDALLYATRTRRLLHVHRGLYASVPAGVSPDQCPDDPYLLAAKLTEDAVVAYHTALEFHGHACSVRWEFFHLTGRRSRPLASRGHHFRAIPFPKALRERHQEGFGVLVAERSGVDVRVASLEAHPGGRTWPIRQTAIRASNGRRSTCADSRRSDGMGRRLHARKTQGAKETECDGLRSTLGVRMVTMEPRP